METTEKARAIALGSALKWSEALDAARRAGNLLPHAEPVTLARTRALETQLEKLQAEYRTTLPSPADDEALVDFTQEPPLSAPAQ